jgi:outer membrane protein assembly factor BamB
MMAGRISVAFAVWAACACAGDWPRFRGPNGSGVAEARNVPEEFGSAKNVRWKTDLPVGHSSPVLIGSRVIVTAFEKAGTGPERPPERPGTSAGAAATGSVVPASSSKEKLLTIALDRDSGKVLWRAEIARTRSDRMHDNNNPATPSVAADADGVYAFFADFGLVGYSLDGKEKWRAPFAPFRSFHGMGASPILAGRTLLLNCDQDVASFLIAIDTATGKTKWRVERNDQTGNGYATPVLNDSGDQVLVLGPRQLTAYSVADGAKLWWVGGLPRQPKGSPIFAKDAEGRPLVIVNIQASGDEQANIARFPPWAIAKVMLDSNKDGKVTKEDLVGPLAGVIEPFTQADANGDGELTEEEWNAYIAFTPNTLLAFRPEGRGDLTKQVLWKQSKSIPNVPSPLVYRDVLYVVKEGGILTSLNPATGEVLKQSRVQGAAGMYFASPVAADGKLYLASQEGAIAVLKAGAQWEVVHVNALNEEIFATPALADGRLYVRTRSALYCFEALQAPKQ